MRLVCPNPDALFAPRRARLCAAFGAASEAKAGASPVVCLYRGDAPFLEDLYYLTGLATYSTAVLLDVATGDVRAWVWPIEFDAAQRQTDVSPLEPHPEPWQALLQALEERRPSRIVVGISDAEAATMGFELQRVSGAVTIEAVLAWTAPLRCVKDEWELACLSEAARIAEEIMIIVRRDLRAGDTERQVAARIVSLLVEAGARRPSLPIVAFGSNTADPHHLPEDRPLAQGDLVLIDIFGETVHHYCAEHTDTFVFGDGHPDGSTRLEAVEMALTAARAAVRPGSTLADVEAIAAGLLEEAGLGAEYPGSCAHHVGLNEHDPTDKRARLIVGGVAALEPGVYGPGFGIRLERVVTVS